MQLDYDISDRQKVEADAKKLLKKHPILRDTYRIEQTKSGHWHVIYPKSMIPTFQQCLEIAKESKCDKDWLSLSEEYGTFALVTDAGKTISKKLRLKAFPPKPRKLPAKDFKQPVMLLLYPETPMDRGRLKAICESITNDPEWEWRMEVTLHDLGTRIRIGCRDTAQAKRRANWLQQQGIKFRWEIITPEQKIEYIDEENE